MNIKSIIPAILVFGIMFPAAGSVRGPHPQTLKAEKQSDGVLVWVADKVFTKYKTAETQKYPYFYPVNGPRSGKSVTTESSNPYPHHHSLFFGCDHVNGGNYWQDINDRGQIVSQDLRIVRGKGESIVFTDSCLWQRPDAPSPFKDQRKITISAPSPDVRIIDFEISMSALIDVVITKTNHSLFSARMVPELSVKSGGTLVNSRGDLSEKGTFGQQAEWCDYWGTRDGKTEGLAIFSNPQNRWHPPRWFTRDYGFFSPTPMFWLENDKLEMKKGESLHLAYRVIVHNGNTEQAGIKELYSTWIKK